MSSPTADPQRHDPPFYRHLGFELGLGTDPSVSLHRSDGLLNSHGAVHGGATLALLDVALSRAVRLHTQPAEGISTVDLTVHFLAPASGLTLRAAGSVLRAGSRLAYAHGDVRSDDGTLVAVATGAYRMLSKH